MPQHTNVRLFTAAEYKDIDWPNDKDGAYAKAYWGAFMRDGAKHYIDNIETEVALLRIDHLAIPVTINDAQWTNSYVCSPYTHFISYAIEELYLLPNRFLRVVLHGIILLLGLFLRITQVNRVVHVNNWLLSTNLYPQITPSQINEITTYLKKRFPTHAIIFRSVQKHFSDEMFIGFCNTGYTSIMSRQIYFFDPKNPKKMKAKPLKQDQKLLRESSYRIISAKSLSLDVLPRIVALYSDLYLNKYSTLNPQFTKAFIALALEQETLFLKVLQTPDGNIDAVLGYFVRNGMMTTPLFGYDTSKPQKIGLYRLLSTILVHDARDKGLLLHQSSGAANFKRLRRAEPAAEYSMVFTRHLAWFRRLPWWTLDVIMKKIGEPLLSKYQL